MILNSPYISGSLTVTGNEVVTGSLTVLGGITGAITGSATSASYATNAELLDGLDSSVFVLSSSFQNYSSSNDGKVAALNTFSASILSYTSSTDDKIAQLNRETASLNLATASLYNTTASLNAAVADIRNATASLYAATSSIYNFTSSANLRIGSLEQYTQSLNTRSASFACVTATNNFACTQYFSNASNAVSFTSTGSLYSDGGMRITKDMYVSGTAFFNNVTVFGTQSVAYISSSQLNIGTNIISVNTDTPSIRFGGLAVYDSGSTGLTGSMLWDSEDNQWIYSNPSGSAYDSAVFLVGPRNVGVLGNETGISCNFLSKGNGMHHMTSSGIFEDGSRTCFYNNSFITNAGVSCFTTSCAASIVGGTICGTTATFNSAANSAPVTLITLNNTGTTSGGPGIASRVAFTAGVTSLGYIQGANHSSGIVGLQFSGDGSTNHVTLNACGNIGIGTITPQSFADNTVKSVNGQSSCGFIFIGQGTNTQLRVGADDSIGGIINNVGAYPLAIYINSAERVRITSTGIACFACQVCAPAAAIGGQVAITAGNGNQLYLNNSGQQYTQITFDHNSCGLSRAYLAWDQTNSFFEMYATTGGGLKFFTNAANERLRITSTGIACFACQVCAPAFVGGTVSGTTGTFSGGNVLVTNVATSCYAFTSVASSWGCTSQIYTGIKIGAAGDNLVGTGVDLRTYHSYGSDAGTEFRLFVNSTSNVLTEALRIDSSRASTFASSVTAAGRVYGTTTGLNSDFNSGGLIAYSCGSTLRYTQVGFDCTGNYGWIQALEQGVAYRNLVLNSAGGNVGIGTNDPQSSLHIYSTNATAIIQNSSTSSVGNISRLFYRALLSSGAIGYIGFIDGVLNSTTDNTGYLKFHTYNNGNADERMRITSTGILGFNGNSAPGNASLDKLSIGYLNGGYGWIQTWNGTPLVLNKEGNNVGVGISSPQATLDVLSTLNIQATGNSDLPYINFSNNGRSFDWGRVGGLLQGDGDGALYFQTKLGGGLTEKLRITSTGIACFAGQVCLATRLVVQGGGNSIFPWSDALDGQPGMFAVSCIGSAISGLYAKVYGPSVNAGIFGTNTQCVAFIGTEGDCNKGLIIGTINSAPIYIGTSNSNRLVISSTGIAIFSCTVCAPLYVGSLRGQTTKAKAVGSMNNGGGSQLIYLTNNVNIEYGINDYSITVFAASNSAEQSSVRVLSAYGYYASSVTTTELSKFIDNSQGHSQISFGVCKASGSSNTYCYAVCFAKSSGVISGYCVNVIKNSSSTGDAGDASPYG
jgi:hypothetical protein